MNLTANSFIGGDPTNPTRDEDPKFAVLPDNNLYIVFKQDRDLMRMTLSGQVLQTYTTDGQTNENSQPYFLPGGTQLLWSKTLQKDSQGNAIPASDVLYIGTAGASGALSDQRQLSVMSGYQQFYTIAWGNNMFLYASWDVANPANPSSTPDFIYSCSVPTSGACPFTQMNVLTFCNSGEDGADPFPADNNNELVFFASLRPGGQRAPGEGDYDLWLGDAITGDTWPLSTFNAGISTTANELGPSYWPGI